MTDPILEFAETDGWQLHGAFVFDGRGQIDDVIRIRGRCPGLAVEGLRFQGFKRSAVRVMNCEGAEARPVLLADLRTNGPVQAEAGIAFEILPNLATRVTQYVVIRNCHFDGVKEQVQVPKPEWIRNVQIK